MPRLPLPIVLYLALASYAVVGGAAPPQAPAPQSATAGTNSLPAPPVALPPPVAFDATTPLVVDRRDQQGDPTFTAFVKNDGSIAQKVELSVVLFGRDNVEVAALVEPSSVAIQPGPPRPLTVTLRKPAAGATVPVGAEDRWGSDVPLRGSVVMKTVRDSSAAAPAPAVRELRVSPIMPSRLADGIAFGSLAAAVIVVVIGVCMAGLGKLFDHLGSISWGQSWASNAAVGSALLTAVMGLGVFPEYTHFMPKSMYPMLSSVFGALVILSPVVYGLFRSAAPKNGTIEYRGVVLMFAVGAVLTLWGATGQLVTLVFAIREVASVEGLPTFLATSLQWMVGGLLAGLLVYGSVGVRQIAGAGQPPSTGSGGQGFGTGNQPPDVQLL